MCIVLTLLLLLLFEITANLMHGSYRKLYNTLAKLRARACSAARVVCAVTLHVC
jgi:hypothetical protein